MPENLAIKAFVFGLISAASLPLGAIVARFWVPKQRAVAAMMAFGAGKSATHGLASSKNILICCSNVAGWAG